MTVTADPVPGPAAHESRLVTISAAYGAGGSVVAPGLAQRLGVPFLQRMTTAEGDVTDSGPCAERLTPDEASSTPVHRVLVSFTHAMPIGPTQSPPSDLLDEDLRCSAEAGIRRLAADGEGVILGRAAAVVLGKDLGFHVRLDGPPCRRAAQGAVIEGIGQEEAMTRMHTADKARTVYVRRLYHANPADASLYHLVIDSTAIPLKAVTEIILQAMSARSMGHSQRRLWPSSGQSPGRCGGREAPGPAVGALDAAQRDSQVKLESGLDRSGPGKITRAGS